jgi:hypothetical protein
LAAEHRIREEEVTESETVRTLTVTARPAWPGGQLCIARSSVEILMVAKLEKLSETA